MRAKLTGTSMGLNSTEQRQLEERLSKRQMQDFMGVRLPSSPPPFAALKNRPSHPFQPANVTRTPGRARS